MSTSIAPPPLDEVVSLADVEFFMSYPFDIFARMRAEAPVYWSENDRAWALTKYEDIRFVSKSPDLFSNRFGQTAPQCRTPDDGRPMVDDPITGRPMTRARGAPGANDRGRGPDILTSVDPPAAHVPPQAGERRVHAEGDRPLEQHVAELAVAQIDRIEPGVEMDFVDDGGGAGADAHDRGDARRVDRPPRRLPPLVRRLHRAERPERRVATRRETDQYIAVDHRVPRLLHRSSCATGTPTRATTCSPRSPTPTTTVSR